MKQLLKGRPAKPIAFAARSNAGKSSLINSLLGDKLARVSKTPGHTRVAHLYQADGFIVVDLPGYGFAKTARWESGGQMEETTAEIAFSQHVRLVLLLLDARRLGLTRLDYNMASALDSQGIRFEPVITKADLVSSQELKLIQEQIPDAWITSSKSRLGCVELHKHLQSLT